VQARDTAGDDEALDLGGAFEDRVGVVDPFGTSVQALPVRGRVRPVALDPADFGAL
jgi:hypothetical protein